jgi:hypothetical protein
MQLLEIRGLLFREDLKALPVLCMVIPALAALWEVPEAGAVHMETTAVAEGEAQAEELSWSIHVVL